MIVMKSNTELRYYRYMKDLNELDKKRERKLKQIEDVRKRLNLDG